MRPHATDLVDERLMHGLHVEARRRAGTHAEHDPHTFFQTSTLDSLFGGKLEGDLTFAELAGHGDLGIGTLNAVEGEMIAVDGRFMRGRAPSRSRVRSTTRCSSSSSTAMPRPTRPPWHCASTASSSWSGPARSPGSGRRTTPSPSWLGSSTCSSCAR